MTDIESTDDRSGRGRPRIALVVGAIVLLVAAALVWYFFIRDDSPDAFDIDDAVSSIEDSEVDGESPDTGSDDAGSDDTGSDSTEQADDAPAGVDGAWVVAPDSGSAAGFRVQEELASIGAATAVGRTESVDGRLAIDGTTVSDVEVIVDMTTLATDDSRRDGRMRDALAVDEFPTATFVLAEPLTLDGVPAEGETVTVTAAGEMTIKGVTNPVQVALDARLVDDRLVVVGSLPVVFADYGVEPPTAPVVVSVDDNGIVEFQLFFSRAQG